MSRAIPGYKGTLYSVGPAQSFSDEPATIDGNIATISDDSLSIFVWQLPVEVFDDGNPVDEADFEVDYLGGRIVFDSPPAGPVTISGNYRPRFELAGITEADFEATAEDIESTTFSDLYEQYVSGLGQISGSFTTISLGDPAELLGNVEEANELVIVHEVVEGFELRAVVKVQSTTEQAVDDRVEITFDYIGKNPAGMTGGQAHYTFVKD